MLKQLIIKNFIFIKDAKIEFSPKFNVITGETGAGKSILLNALGITLGNKIDLSLISPGKDKIEVTSTFDIRNNTLLKKKYSHLIDENEHNLTLKREVSQEGKSRCLINGQPANLSILKEISEKLIDIHSQHQNQYLFNNEYNLYFFDQTLNLKKQLAQYKKFFFQLKSLRTKYSEISAEENQLKEEKEFVLYSIKEFEGKFLEEKEYRKLKDRLKEVEVLEKAHHSLSEFKEAFFSQAIPNLEKAADKIDKVNLSDKFNSKSKDLVLLIEQLRELGESFLQVSGFKDNHNYLYEIDELNQKLSGTEKLLRKYNTDHSTLLSKYQALKSKIDRLENSEFEKKKLFNELKETETICWKAALLLNKVRKAGVAAFEESINKEIKDLEIKNAFFKVELTPELKDNDDLEIWKDSFNERGLNKLEFLFSSGKGLNPQPLKKIVSGGELSRIMLAIKRLLNQFFPNEAIIFDEIDTGVGGIAAVKVGNKIKEISDSKQVIVITHLPQIAKFADRHFRIDKITDQEGKSQTEILLLEEKELIEEFTRMIGKASSEENIRLTKKIIYEE